LRTATDGITGAVQTIGYDAAGQVSTVNYGAARVRTFGYDDVGRLTSDTLRNGAGQTVASIGYGYDLEDRLTRKVTTGTAGAGDNTYTHDFAGRLTSWTGPAGTTPYRWDDSGNRVTAGPKTATYDERNRLLSDGDFTYAYTARGTMRSRTSSGLTEQYSFDAFDRLVTGASQNYSYDGLDRVAARNGTAFQYAGPGDEVVSDGTELYARGPADELLAVSQGQKKRLTVSDQHGDVVAALDPADTALAAPADTATYDPFGRVTARTGDTGHLGFQGDWTDSATGQVDLGARWYDPGTGGFTSRDTADYTRGDSILANRYTYAAGDPVDQNDPDGHWPKWIKKAAGAVGGAIRTAASTIGSAIVAGAQLAWSAIKAAANAISDAARWVYDKAKAAVSWVANTVSAAAHWLANKASAVANWAKQKAEQVRQAAVAQAKAIAQTARRAVTYAVQHSPLPALQAALKPLYTGLKTVVSAAAHLPAAVVSTVRDVVNDASKAAQLLYQQAVDTAGAVVENVSKAVDAAANWVDAHQAQIAGFLAGAVVGLGCGALIGWTGVGAVACGALAGAVGSVVSDMVEGGHGWKEMLVNGAIGGAIGGLTGGAFAVGGQAVGAGVRAGGQAARTAARDEIGDIAGGRMTGGALSKAGCANSFAPNTAVLMADGSHKPISQVGIGDKVMTTDPTTGRTEPRPVVDTIVGQGDKNLVEVTVPTAVTVDAATPRSGVVVATDHHPFWVENLHKWVDATDLRAGQLMRTSAGTYVQVTAIKRWTAHNQRVHNLTIDTTHTYYVLAGTTPVLVHNCGDEPVLFGQARVGPNFSKDGAFNGRSIYDVAEDLKAGRLNPDDVKINAFRHDKTGALVTENNRSLAALSLVGMKPTTINMVEASPKLLRRLGEVGPLGDWLPSTRVAVT
ncbi:MAG: hypothetical protein QOI74_4011, partial [Micromonosporaceae bacterium]|nr:hypothetical protein [Micromonosporaceae bacterium]